MHRALRYFSLVLALSLVATAAAAPPQVKPGIDVLIEKDFAPLRNQRVGLITNATGITSDMRSTADVLHEAPEVKLVALFGPEHGVRGEVTAGGKIEDSRDERTGLPVYSLYGDNRKPTAEMLAKLDTLVFDIQDIGSRSYTFISTMAAAMEAASEHGKRFVVLDRPNPLSGNKVEGRPADMAFKSFVGYLPVTYVHGLTVGELAEMINGEGWLPSGRKCDLHVVKMRGWRRNMWFEETGLPWVLTSPHIPRSDVSMFYAATGVMGELRTMSEGVGYTLPFELAGMPGLDPYALADDLNARNLPGVQFRPLYYVPYYASYAKETCGGVQIYITDRDRVALTPIQFHIMDAVRKLKPETKFFGNKRDNMFDKVCGTDRVRKAWESGKSLEVVLAIWNEDVQTFEALRKAYLLYR
jgi:uncharacterized protein YbbC (DUF1343 family)